MAERYDGARMQISLYGDETAKLEDVLDAAEIVLKRFPMANVDVRVHIKENEKAASGN